MTNIHKIECTGFTRTFLVSTKNLFWPSTEIHSWDLKRILRLKVQKSEVLSIYFILNIDTVYFSRGIKGENTMSKDDMLKSNFWRSRKKFFCSEGGTPSFLSYWTSLTTKSMELFKSTKTTLCQLPRQSPGPPTNPSPTGPKVPYGVWVTTSWVLR